MTQPAMIEGPDVFLACLAGCNAENANVPAYMVIDLSQQALRQLSERMLRFASCREVDERLHAMTYVWNALDVYAVETQPTEEAEDMKTDCFYAIAARPTNTRWVKSAALEIDWLRVRAKRARGIAATWFIEVADAALNSPRLDLAVVCALRDRQDAGQPFRPDEQFPCAG